VQIQFTDFNGADDLFASTYRDEWQDVDEVIAGMPLHLKASDQAGLLGNPIFDPVGTNAYLKNALVTRNWLTRVPIPSAFAFLGTDVDFVKSAVLGEAQFSTYAFLLNNVVRSELFAKSQLAIAGAPIRAVMIITKAHMFPASNSTLYYEQARNQLNELARNHVFDVPMRLVGLFETPGTTVDGVWTSYHASRYSRTVVTSTKMRCETLNPRRSGSRCAIRVIHDPV
jgi:hypothetical protein